eukprot:5407218-Prymnesium_polylepis.1
MSRFRLDSPCFGCSTPLRLRFALWHDARHAPRARTTTKDRMRRQRVLKHAPGRGCVVALLGRQVARPLVPDRASRKSNCREVCRT